MYSAARSSPREGVPRPSSRSEARNDRFPRMEFAEIWSRAALRSGLIVAFQGSAGAAAIHAARTKKSKAGLSFELFIGLSFSVHIDELVHVEQYMAQRGECRIGGLDTGRDAVAKIQAV